MIPVRFREATREDVPAVVALLRDDAIGAGREMGRAEHYLAAFDAMQEEGGNHLIVGDQDGDVVATYHLTFITGLTLQGMRRAQLEGVRVASHLRGSGVGALMIVDAETRARAAGCGMMQLAMNAKRDRSHWFYVAHGFKPSHTGFKRMLD